MEKYEIDTCVYFYKEKNMKKKVQLWVLKKLY